MNDTHSRTIADAAWFEQQRSRYDYQLRDDQRMLKQELDRDDYNEAHEGEEE